MRLYRFIKRLLPVLTRPLFRLRIIDNRTEEARRPYLVVSNHLSNWDPVFIVDALKAEVSFLAKAELFRCRVLAAFLKMLSVIPIKRGENDISAVRNSIQAVREGKVLFLFPQGTRYTGVEPQSEQAKDGTSYIARLSKADIVPVGIYTKNFRVRPFRRVTVVIGDAIRNEALFGAQEKNDKKEATNMIFDQILAMVHIARRD